MPTLLTAKGILYDMDGTLVDTTECVESAWKQKAAKYGVDGDELIKHMHGRTCLDTLRTFFPPECHSKQFADNFENEFVNITEGVYPVPGVHPAVTAVSPERWAVVTAASRMWALARLGQVGLPEPKLLIAADDVTKGKPHPEGYLAGAKALGLEGKDVVVFEDAVSGVKAALAAGATVIALTTSTTREKLAEAGAQHIVDDFTKVDITDHTTHLSIVLRE